MLPRIKIGFLQIPSYSLMVLCGVIGFVITTIYLLEKKEKNDSKITNRLLIISIFGFISLTVFAFLVNSFFHSIKEQKIILGGITWLGGVLGAFPCMIWMIHKFCPMVRGEALTYFNKLIPGIVLAHGFGRIGCFLGGCCYGTVTDSILGISFPAGSVAAQNYPGLNGQSLPVLPTQLLEAVFEFALFTIMILLYDKLKHHLLELYAFSYGVFRFIIEFWRGDDRGSTGVFLSPSQIMSIILIIAGVLLILYHRKIVFKKLHVKMDAYIEKRGNRESCDNTEREEIIKTIRELKALVDEGIIHEEEFQRKKTELLQKI